MILYNVTVKVDGNVADEWLQWMREHHVIDVLRTGLFLQARILRLMHQDDDDGGQTFAIQYSLPNEQALHQYQREFAPKLQKEHTERYDGKFVAFRTVLQTIEEYNVKHH